MQPSPEVQVRSVPEKNTGIPHEDAPDDAAEVKRLTSSIALMQELIAGAPSASVQPQAAEAESRRAVAGTSGGQAALAAALLQRRAEYDQNQLQSPSKGSYTRPSRDEIRKVMNMAASFLGPAGAETKPFPKAPGPSSTGSEED